MVNKVGWSFWRWWVLASAGGLGIGLVVYLPLRLNLGYDSELNVVIQTLIAAVAGAILGGSIGIAQWLVLRRIFRPERWVVAVIVGGAVAGAISLPVGEIAGEAGGFAMAIGVGGAIFGASVGIAQWLVLRGKVSGAIWLVLANTLGLVMGLVMARVMGGVAAGIVGSEMERVVGTFVALPFAVGVYGVITGGILMWLLRQTAAKGLDPSHAAQ